MSQPEVCTKCLAQSESGWRWTEGFGRLWKLDHLDRLICFLVTILCSWAKRCAPRFSRLVKWTRSLRLWVGISCRRRTAQWKRLPCFQPTASITITIKQLCSSVPYSLHLVIVWQSSAWAVHRFSDFSIRYLTGSKLDEAIVLLTRSQFCFGAMSCRLFLFTEIEAASFQTWSPACSFDTLDSTWMIFPCTAPQGLSELETGISLTFVESFLSSNWTCWTLVPIPDHHHSNFDRQLHCLEKICSLRPLQASLASASSWRNLGTAPFWPHFGYFYCFSSWSENWLPLGFSWRCAPRSLDLDPLPLRWDPRRGTCRIVTARVELKRSETGTSRLSCPKTGHASPRMIAIQWTQINSSLI